MTLSWWTARDNTLVQEYRAWLALPAEKMLESRTAGQSWNDRCSCRTCHWWRSTDGRSGRCTIPETPATVNCGKTAAHDLCEQYDARDPAPAVQAELAL